MKTTKLIARIVLSPLIFVIVFVFTLIIAVNNLILFARYGGEFINHDKDDSKHIYDIYELLKEQNKDSKDGRDDVDKFKNQSLRDCAECENKFWWCSKEEYIKCTNGVINNFKQIPKP